MTISLMQRAAARRQAPQDWSVGQYVNVGFMRDLEVIEKIPTPGDHAPDAYVLKRDNRVRVTGGGVHFYRFVPHKGIERRSSLTDARKA